MMMLQQRLDLAPKLSVARTDFIEECPALLRLSAQRLLEEFLGPRPSVLIH